jgi:hypothetical protein
VTAIPAIAARTAPTATALSTAKMTGSEANDEAVKLFSRSIRGDKEHARAKPNPCYANGACYRNR